MLYKEKVYKNKNMIRQISPETRAKMGRAKRKHGMLVDRARKGVPNIYSAWASMMRRCDSPKNKGYARYGGRGIKVCERWKNFQNFYEDFGQFARKGYSIGRIDNDGDYEPSNCEWQTRTQQNSNTSRNVIFNGETAIQASRRLGGRWSTVSQRIRNGWPIEKAFTTPVKKYNHVK